MLQAAAEPTGGSEHARQEYLHRFLVEQEKIVRVSDMFPTEAATLPTDSLRFRELNP